MATFNKHYTTSELLNLLKRGSLTHYFWSYNNNLYTFYFVDNRHTYFNNNGFIDIVAHRSNYFRLRNKLNSLPFCLSLNPHSKEGNMYLFTIVPDSVFLNEGSSDKLNQLNEQFDGKRIVNVVVL